MIEFDITGDEEISRVLRELPAAIAREAALDSLIEACEPTIEAARAGAPVDTGGLRDSIGGVIRKYMHGLRLLFVIGPRWGWGKDGREPARYAHLVEYGHFIVTGGKLGMESNPFAVHTKQGVLGGFVAPRPFLRPAWDSTKEQVLAKFRLLFGAKVEAIVRRRAAKTAAGEARAYKAWDAMQAEPVQEEAA